MLKQAIRYRNFLFYSLPASLCSTTADQIPSFLLNNFFGSAIVGLFDLPKRIMMAPTALISDSILNVFQERASRDYREQGNCRSIYIKTFKALFVLAIVPFSLLFIFAPALIPFVFGSTWQIAGEYARYLSILSFVIFIASPLGYTLYIAEKQNTHFIWQAFFLVVSIVSILFGVHLGNPRSSVICFSLSGSLMYIIYLALSYYFSSSKSGKC
jgi:O-antigen/teichoic acid export membrane protein